MEHLDGEVVDVVVQPLLSPLSFLPTNLHFHEDASASALKVLHIFRLFFTCNMLGQFKK
jgi:hypothetical protein